MSDLQRELGRLDERTNHHADRLQRIEDKLDHIVSAIDGAKGGWKALVAAGAVASVITATAMKIIGAVAAVIR
jgi:hypothetical protein